MIKVSRLHRLNKEDLESGKFLNDHQRWLREQFECNYDGFLIIIRSNFGKEFAFYIPHKFEEIKNDKFTGNHLAFYWINGDQLVTVTNSKYPRF